MSEVRKRYLWVAILLAFLSPFLSMLYLGRGYRALAYWLAELASVGIALLLAQAELWPEDVGWILAVWPVKIVGIVDSVRVCRKVQQEFYGRWYSRWWGIPVIVASVWIVVLSIRWFVVEPFRIPSGAMMPTLLIGDHILVNK